MKEWLDHIDLPEKIFGCLMALGGLLALAPKMLRLLVSFYNGGKFTLEVREHFLHMETRIMDRLCQIDDGQCNILEVRRQMLDADRDTAYFMSDARGNTEWVSRTWTLWTGVDNMSARGSGWENGIAPEDRPRVMQNWELAIDHQRNYEDRYHYIDRLGKRTEVDVVAHPIRRKDGTVLNYFGNARIRDAKPPPQHLAAAAPNQ